MSDYEEGRRDARAGAPPAHTSAEYLRGHADGRRPIRELRSILMSDVRPPGADTMRALEQRYRKGYVSGARAALEMLREGVDVEQVTAHLEQIERWALGWRAGCEQPPAPRPRRHARGPR